jgi:hypothetical protein
MKQSTPLRVFLCVAASAGLAGCSLDGDAARDDDVVGRPGLPGAPGTDGEDGVDGADGQFVSVLAAPPDACDGRGGVVLQAAGQAPVTLCNGRDGTDGADGTAGQSITVTNVLADPQGPCGIAGGQQLDSISGTHYVCNALTSPSTQIVRADFTALKGQYAQGSVRCPPEMRALSGGVHVHDGLASVQVQSSAPRPQLDGWEGLVRNDRTDRDVQFYVLALCVSTVEITAQFNDGVLVDDAIGPRN